MPLSQTAVWIGIPSSTSAITTCNCSFVQFLGFFFFQHVFLVPAFWDYSYLAGFAQGILGGRHARRLLLGLDCILAARLSFRPGSSLSGTCLLLQREAMQRHVLGFACFCHCTSNVPTLGLLESRLPSSKCRLSSSRAYPHSSGKSGTSCCAAVIVVYCSQESLAPLLGIRSGKLKLLQRSTSFVTTSD